MSPPEDLLAWWFGRQRLGMGPGLERVRTLLAEFGDPHTAFDTILVAGTNGKGSTTAMLAALLATQTPTARFISPHLVDVRERFVIDGRPVASAALVSSLERIREAADATRATFFEIATAVACDLFARAGVRRAVFEVGVGGTWDCTNALDPVLSIVSSVALDHVAILGGDVVTIARDKAGILRPTRPAITGAHGDARDEIERVAREIGAPLWRLGAEIDLASRSLGWEGSEVAVATPAGEVHTRIALLGAHQPENAALAVAAAQRLGVPDADIAAVLPTVQWPGRLEPFDREGRRVLLDGAHNPSAAAALATSLDTLGVSEVGLVLGISANKDVAGVVAELVARARWTVATKAARSRRGLEAEAIAAAVRGARPEADVEVVEPPDAALARALERARPGDVIVVAGSLFLVGELRSVLTGTEPEAWIRDQ